MNFAEIIKKINEDKRLVPDLMKSEKGNNFRAVSESAILDVVDPVLKEAEWYYTVEIKKSDLQIREAYGKNGRKLQFIATVEIKVIFRGKDVVESNRPLMLSVDKDLKVETEAVGMGIDDNDKAMGKAYTYALKYALLKIFRLRYADDPDYKASEDLLVDKPKPEKEEKNPAKKEKKPAKEQEMTESQRSYITGLMDQKGISSQQIMSKFDGYDPVDDDYVPMTVARAMIKFLTEQDDLPF